MRIALIFLLALLPVLGCARKKPPPLVVLPQTATGPGGGKTATGWNAFRPKAAANPTYQGRTPTQWAEQLQNQDYAERSRASTALANMGEAGYPSLRDGMRNRSVEVRLACLQAIGKPVLVAHRGEMLPLLTGMLRDPEPRLRRSAAARLAWFGGEGRSALPDLQNTAEHDDQPDIRQIARLSIRIIENPNSLRQGAE